jgi:hypothetical protein
MQRFLLALLVAAGVQGGAGVAQAADPCSPEAYAEACKAYPVKAGEHKQVESLYVPGVKYDIYLPASYNPANEEGYPVLYTYCQQCAMVADLQRLADKHNIIVVGNLAVGGNGKDDDRVGENYAMLGDIRARVRIDPTLQFAGGFQNGAVASYALGRSYCQQLAGVLAMDGMIGGEYRWNRDFWFPAGLLVARVAGNDDKFANNWAPVDLAHLQVNKAVVHDFSLSGAGQALPGDSVKEDALKWLLEQAKKKRDAKGLQKGKEFDAKCAALALSGKDAQMFTLCVQAIATKPRQWEAFYAQRRLDVLLKDRARFDAGKPQLPVNLPRPALFCLESQLEGAACAGDVESFRSLARCLQGGARRPSRFAIWHMAVSQKQGISDPKQALVLARALPASACGPREMMAVAAAYAANGDARRADSLCDKIRAMGGNDNIFKSMTDNTLKLIHDLGEANKKKP